MYQSNAGTPTRNSPTSAHSNESLSPGAHGAFRASVSLLHIIPSFDVFRQLMDPHSPSSPPHSPQADGIPKLVHSLVASTKSLQDILRDWSNGRANELQVSDIYVQIGTEFNSIVAAFRGYQIDMRFVILLSSILAIHLIENCSM